MFPKVLVTQWVVCMSAGFSGLKKCTKIEKVKDNVKGICDNEVVWQEIYFHIYCF